MTLKDAPLHRRGVVMDTVDVLMLPVLICHLRAKYKKR